MLMLKYKYLILAASTLLAIPAQAATIDVGNRFLIPNKADQVVRIMVSGGEQVSGLNFFAQIGDGGPELSEFGLDPGTPAPTITAVDIKSGTIFDGIPDDQSNDYSIPQVAMYSIAITEPEGSVPADGVLATLTFDTTGYTTGTWDFLLTGVLPDFPGGPFDTELVSTRIPELNNIQNGTISIAIAGDCNLDGRVDEKDATILATNWKMGTIYGNVVGGGVGWTGGDLNNDGRVNNLDAEIIAVNWMQTADPAAVSVPEPATASLLSIVLLAVAAFLRPRRKHC
ncbi:MAG: PEP-CTERM sorting domain-containing protein [Pirellulales bacterium]|nr:PEP-CTERM sorting domain-containing protein [Pirellulales bacterium]